MGFLDSLVTVGGSLLGGLASKKKKSTQIPNVSLPGNGDYESYAPLTKLSRSRLNGEGLGFGDDFVSKATNPVIQDRTRRFNEQTVPTLSNQASARGLGRSSLATKSIQRADRDTQNDIDQLQSQFYTLDQQQRKKDTSEAVGIEQDLMNKAIARNMAQAGFDTGIPVQQAAVNQSTAGQNYLNQASGSEAGLGVGDLLSSIMKPKTATGQADTASNSYIGSPNARISGTSSDELIKRLLALQALKGA